MCISNNDWLFHARVLAKLLRDDRVHSSKRNFYGGSKCPLGETLKFVFL